MKLKIKKEDMVRIVNISQRAVLSNNPIQILDGILLIAKDNKLKLISTDMDMTIETESPCLVEEAGEIVINSSLLGDIVKKLPAGEININIRDKNVEIYSKDSQFYLNGQSSDEFPLSPTYDENSEVFNIKSEDLVKAVRQTEFATSLDVTKPHLNGIFLEKKKDNLRFVAIDGYRLAVSDIACDGNSDMEVIVQKKALIELSRIVKEDTLTSIRKSNGHIIFENESTRLYSRLIDKKYLDYKIILEMDVKNEILVDKKLLLNAIERASLLLRRGKVNLVKLSIKDNNINISSNSEIGTSNEDIYCQLKGDGLNIAFNANYLIEGLRVINDDNIILKCNQSLDPMKIIGEKDGNYVYLVLPVRVSN